MGEKLISFSQFCQEIKTHLFEYMPDKYSDKKYKIIIEEKKDDFEQITTYLRLESKKEQIFEAPQLSLDVAYENMKKIKDKEAILRSIAVMYDKMYRSFVQVEDNNSQIVQPLTIEKISGNFQYNISEVYVVTKPKETTWELYGNDILEELAVELGQDLLVITISDNEKMVLEADSIQTMKDMKEIMKEMKACGYSFLDETIMLYQMEQQGFIVEEEKIDMVLIKKEYKKSSIFHKK